MPNKVAAILTFLLAFGLIALPWFLAGNLPPVRTVLLAVFSVLLLGILLTPSLVGKPTWLGLSMKFILLLGVGMVSLSLLPTSYLTGAGAAFSDIQTDYPAATRARLCELLLGIAAFVVSSCIFSKREWLPFFFALVAFNGVLLTFVGIVFSVSSSDKVMGFYELINGGDPFGPFVNGNNAGGYLLLCFSAAIYFLGKRVFQSQGNGGNGGLRGELQSGGVVNESFRAIGREFASLEAKHLYAYAAIALIGAGVFATLSRGAAVAFVVAAVVASVFLFRKSWPSFAMTLVVMGGGIGFLVWSEENQAIASNLGTLGDLESASEQRLAHWGDAWNAAQSDLVFGSGLGTYPFTYPALQTTHFNRWFKHAENQYLEALAELGIVGLVILLAAIGLTIYASYNLLSKPDSNSRAVGVVGLFAIISQMIAGAVDFGLYQPANSILMATIVGIVFAQHNWFWTAQNVAQQKSANLRVALGMLTVLLLLGSTTWATYEYSAVDARRAARRFQERFVPESDESSIGFYQDLLTYSLRIRPDDSEAHYHMAMSKILQYRMDGAKAMLTPLNVAELNLDPDLNEEQRQEQIELAESMQPKDINEAWSRTTMYALHRMARISSKIDQEFFRQLSESDAVKDHLSAAWEHLTRAEESFDRLWIPQLRLAQLSCVLGHGDQEAEHRRLALERCPNNSKSLYAVGLMEHQSGETAAACEHWRKCLALSGEFEGPIIQHCRFEMGMKTFFEEVLPTDAYYRLRIAKKYFNAKEDLILKKLLLNHTKMVLDQHDYSESERRYLIGQIELDSQNYPVASMYFRKALEAEEERADWRAQYARSLIAESNYDEAIKQLKICQMYHGDHQLLTSKLLKQAKKRRIKEN